MKSKNFLGLALLSVLIIFIFYFNCTKKSTRSYYNRDYYLYVSNEAGYPESMIYVISTETDSLVDSISLGPYHIPGKLALSPNKRTLYATVVIWDSSGRHYTTTHYEIDTKTKAIKYIGPNSNPIISPDGKYLFCSGGVFCIIDAFTHQVIYEENIYFYPICFDGRNHLVYGLIDDGCGVFNYKNKVWVRTINIFPGEGVLSPDGDRLYYITADATRAYFGVYDLIADSIIVKFQINSPGKIAITPDGQYVYLTDPGGGGGCISIEPEPTGKLGVFDTKTNTPLPSIDLSPPGDPSLNLGPYYISITPDGTKAYLSFCINIILVIDLIRNEPLKTIMFPNRDMSLFYIAL
jgi:DNA-binding beta-propeller fold protein YncE